MSQMFPSFGKLYIAICTDLFTFIKKIIIMKTFHFFTSRHIPKSAGSSLKHVMGTCMNKVMASRDAMLLCGESNSDEIELCQSHLGTFVPLDTSESEGIGKAKKLGLVPSKLADVVISNDFRAGSSLFMANHGGRVSFFFFFTFFIMQHILWYD